MIVVNASLTAGVVLVAIGAGMVWGVGAGWLAGGALVLALTLYKIERTR